ncbi:bacteriohemerythrin [Anaerovibrio slackiae]|uniref:Bacteriohemerythrin n=1 Tax=Anaerovibrio slackiae TaxID=2652309 RepID=A0A6I2UIP4_9FIRM|nr:hemerythrin family protein [Anaerovibrio slackiae]MBQ2410165.1 hemerythrin family protein [Selenomonadaceae bacterium]MBQ5585405.1 hemerythrin family protein [Selenomonadaceae bacterium]MBQ5651858.1 hemerythrin family protein [Selenomonadaceae bacterium]MBQ5733369.1 hemerythrin family protein [Selenomonadaceae bacterium]MBQ5822642.1 hemerythrin family protein [Selenomonadaceae bacterium]
MKYEFTKDYHTGIDFIDEEHAKLFEIANRAYDLLTNQFVTDKYDAIVAVLEELRDYTKYHFNHEEEYMKSINYPKRFSQLHQHTQFINKLESYNLKEIDVNQQEGLLEILDFLALWLQSHIKGMDKKIGEAAK